MITALSLVLALTALLVFWWALRSTFSFRQWIAPLFLVLTVGAVLVGRPHEDILGGLDGGAYLCMGARLAAEQTPFYTDPFLSTIPSDARQNFLYPYPYATKYGTEWIRDLAAARTGPWFQPAYPLLLSGVIRAFGFRMSLYVVPLFFLATALLLGRLALLITGDLRARWVAPLLYITCPIAVWQGRFPRPEIIASFFVMAGLCQLMSTRGDDRASIPNLFFAGLALGLAPFFHILSGTVTLLTSLWVYGRLWHGRRREVVFFVPLAVLFSLFLAQTLLWTDTYGLARFVRPWICRPLGLLSLLAAFALMFGAPMIFRKTTAFHRPLWLTRPWSHLAAGLLLVACTAGVYYWALQTRPDYSQPPAYHYIFRTDLSSAVSFLSQPIALSSLFGAFLLCAFPHRFDPRGRTILFLLWPAALLIGDIHDLFMTRYFMVTLVPVVVLSITALLCRFLSPTETRRRHALLPLLALLIVIPLPARLPLIQVTENKNFLSSFEKISQPIRESNGDLVAEYSPLGAPFDHILGIPTLPLDNEHLPDYEQAENALADAFARDPGRTHYFLTPFRQPLSDRFTFRFVDRCQISFQRVLSRRWALPNHVASHSLSLSLYEMSLAPPKPATPPILYPADPSRTGQRNIGKCVQRDITLDGFNITPTSGFQLAAQHPESTLYVILWTDSEENLAFHAGEPTAPLLPTVPLLPHWRLLTLEAGNHPKTLFPSTPTRLHSAFELASGTISPLPITLDGHGQPLSSLSWSSPVHFRWADPTYRFGLPTSADPLLLLMNLASKESSTLEIQITANQVPAGPSMSIPANQWKWILCMPPPLGDPFSWFTCSVQAADPRYGIAAWGRLPPPSFIPDLTAFPSTSSP